MRAGTWLKQATAVFAVLVAAAWLSLPAAHAQGGLIKSFGDVREDKPAVAIGVPQAPNCPYEKLPPLTTKCPACEGELDHVNQIRARVTELNKQIADVQCEIDVITAGGPKIAKSDTCPDGSPLGSGTKYRLGFFYKGDQFGPIGPLPRLSAHVYQLTDSHYDLETFDSFDDMMNTILDKVPAPIDRTAQCGNCISQLTIYQHGQVSERKSASGEKTEIPAGVVAIGDLQIDGAGAASIDRKTERLKSTGAMGRFNKPTIDRLTRLKHLLCEGAAVSFITCLQASVEDGRRAGRVLANELGVPVLLPNFSVPIKTCPPALGEQRSGWVQLDPHAETPPPGPSPQDKLRQAREARLAALKRDKNAAETILAAASARLLACEDRCLLSGYAKALGELLTTNQPVVQVEQIHHRTGDNFFGPDYDPVREAQSSAGMSTGGGSGGGGGGETVAVVNNIPVSRLTLAGPDVCPTNHYHGGAKNCNGVFVADPAPFACGQGTSVTLIPVSACPDL